jgi:hypothetical protein
MMNFTFADVPILLVVFLIVFLPIAFGFLMALGQDLYFAMRGRPISGKCGEHFTMTQDVSEMRKAQKDLREGRLPLIETQLALLVASNNRIEGNIQDLFKKWDDFVKNLTNNK